MMKSRGKSFEKVIQESFEKVPGVSIDRIPDQVTKFKGSTNICDFMVYHKPHLYYIECKSVQGNTLSIFSNPKPDKKGELHGFYGNIRDNQWEGLLEKSKIPGVVAGVICWWVDKDVTLFIPIQLLEYLREKGDKSIRYDCDWNVGIPGENPFTFKAVYKCIPIQGEKKRVFFDYDMTDFLRRVNNVV